MKSLTNNRNWAQRSSGIYEVQIEAQILCFMDDNVRGKAYLLTAISWYWRYWN